MNTLTLEIVHKDLQHKGYYNPAAEGFKVMYRNYSTRDKAFKKLIKTIKTSDFIQKYIIKEYAGKHEYYKPAEIIGEYTEDDLFDMELM